MLVLAQATRDLEVAIETRNRDVFYQRLDEFRDKFPDKDGYDTLSGVYEEYYLIGWARDGIRDALVTYRLRK